MSQKQDQSQNKKLRWGIMSGARINRRLVPGLKAAKNAELAAVASRNQSKAEEIAKEYGASKAYGSYDDLLFDPDIDVVYIPLPNSLHVEWAIKAAAAGKHALVEKPLALEPGDIEELEQVAHQARVVVMEAFMYRFHPQQQKVKELLASGVIGEVKTLRATNAFVLENDSYNIRLDEGVGGGATWDVGCYGVNVARFIFESEPLTVFAEGISRPGNSVDTSVAAILNFSGNRRAVLDYSLDYGRRSFYEVMGSKGTISVENMWQEADLPARIYIRNEKGLQTEELAPADHFQLEVEALSQAAIEGKEAPYSLRDAMANTEVCLAILKSIKEGKQVSLQ